MADFINTVDILGDDVVTDSIIDRSITTYNDDVVTIIGLSAFSCCAVLTSVNLPAAITIGRSAFAKCEGLTCVDLSAVTNIHDFALSDCTAISALIIRNTEQIPVLEFASALIRSSIAKGTGYIYVPAALVDSYKVATNWSKYANQFRALEDYTVDGTITGALDPTKI